MVCALMSAGGASVVAVSSASGPAQSPLAAKPVIGKPITVPARALSGKRFTLAFKVTRSDTGAALLRGRIFCDPTVGGKVIAHAESFRTGKARLSFVVPASAAGKLLRVKLTIVSAGRSATRAATFTVLRGTPLPSLSVGDASVVEGNTGATTLSFPATLSVADAQAVTVRYSTGDGTAAAPADYVARSGKLTFGPGDTTKIITVLVAGDRAVEQTETLRLMLSSPTNAKLANSAATGTITDDDVRSGHYAGTTSQGLPVSFDIPAGVTIVENLYIGIDWTCVDTPVKPWWKASSYPGYFATIEADLGFSYTSKSANPDGSTELVLTGRLTPPGTATGRLRIDLVSNRNAWGIPNLRCSTGDVSWTAS